MTVPEAGDERGRVFATVHVAALARTACLHIEKCLVQDVGVIAVDRALNLQFPIALVPVPLRTRTGDDTSRG